MRGWIRRIAYHETFNCKDYLSTRRFYDSPALDEVYEQLRSGRAPAAERLALLEEAPDLYYAHEHYLGYDAVLVRMDKLTPELLLDLLVMAYRFVTRRRGARGPMASSHAE